MHQGRQESKGDTGWFVSKRADGLQRTRTEKIPGTNMSRTVPLWELRLRNIKNGNIHSFIDDGIRADGVPHQSRAELYRAVGKVLDDGSDLPVFFLDEKVEGLRRDLENQAVSVADKEITEKMLELIGVGHAKAMVAYEEAKRQMAGKAKPPPKPNEEAVAKLAAKFSDDKDKKDGKQGNQGR